MPGLRHLVRISILVTVLSALCMGAQAFDISYSVKTEGVVRSYFESLCELPRPLAAYECKRSLAHITEEWNSVSKEMLFIDIAWGANSGLVQGFLLDAVRKRDRYIAQAGRWTARYDLPSRPGQRD